MSTENISVFDIFKIGIGPSSSHTLGPWKAALQFLNNLKLQNKITLIGSLKILLYGSLAKTGKGHGTDIAVLLGLCGFNPETFDVAIIQSTINQINVSHELNILGEKIISFNPTEELTFLMNESLPYHPNALSFLCTFTNGDQIAETYYSIGGGFVIKEGESKNTSALVELPFPIEKADDLIHWCMKTGMNISEIVLENEHAWRPEIETKQGVLKIWNTMKACIFNGCNTYGELPGGLHVERRASPLNKKLLGDKKYHDYDSWAAQILTTLPSFNNTLDWVSCFALAVNEENASFSRVVTAPTNGAAGVVPAVLHYFISFCNGNTDAQIIQFLLVASEIGSIFKKGATLSAAMGGCQAEIGVSSAMAAAALTECMGGSIKQALMAAEIAMEHHLGMTCDPVGGLVQVPCIERNTMGAIKAITASQLALQSNPDNARVSLDKVVKSMWETALDMNHKYKETAEGGLAHNISVGLSEC